MSSTYVVCIDCRFYPSKVKQLIEAVVSKYMAEKDYDHNQAKTWAEDVVDQIKSEVKTLNIPNYKIVVQSVIGQLTGQGVRVTSKCFWDHKTDNFATFTYENQSLFCTAVVYGVYYT